MVGPNTRSSARNEADESDEVGAAGRSEDVPNQEAVVAREESLHEKTSAAASRDLGIDVGAAFADINNFLSEIV